MLEPDDEVLRDAIERDHRHPLWDVLVDWTGRGEYAGPFADLSDVVETIEVERSLTGDLPEETGQVDGFVSSTAKVTLRGYREGSSDHIGRELSRYNAAGPRGGRALVAPNLAVALGFATEEGPKLLPRFEGYVRKLGFDEEDGTVAVEAVDPSELLRASITLPTYAEFITHIHRRGWPWKLTVNTQWVLDYVLGQNGIHASPPPRDDAIIAASGHGGLVAERGFNGAPVSLYGDGPSSGLWTEDSNPFGMLATPENRSGGTVAYQEFLGTGTLRFAAGYGVGIAMWLHMSNTLGLGASFENRILQVRVTENEYPRLFVSGFGNGDLYMGLTTAAGQVYGTSRKPSGSAPWDFLTVHWEFLTNTQLRVSTHWNGVDYVDTLTVPDTSGHRVRPIVHMRGQCFRAWMLLQLWLARTPPDTATIDAMSGWDFVPQADIARGANELLYLPDVAAAESWDVMRDAVAAEFGVQGFDAGRYSFRPRTDTRAETIDVELDVDANLLGASYSESAEAARNVVSYKTQAGYHSGEYQTVLQGDDPEQFICWPGITEFDLDWPFGAANWRGGVLPYYFTDQWNGDVVEGWTYSYEAPFPNNGLWTGGANPWNIEVYWTQVGNRTIRIRVNNTGTARIRLGTPADPQAPNERRGECALRIAGWPFVEPVEHVGEVRSPEAIELHGHERALPLPDNEWRQHPEPLQPIARSILDALVEGPVVLEDLPIIGDPRVQPGDVARCWFRDVDVPVVGSVVKYVDAVEDGEGLAGAVSIRPLPVRTLAPPGWSFYLDVSHHQGGANPLDLARVRGLGYAGLVARIGQGGGVRGDNGGTHGEVADTWWTTWRDQGLALWGRDLVAGYWYLGNVETPEAQAARCLSLIGDPSIPVMLDWEEGSGDWANLLACLDAFRAAGLTVTMVYAARGYASANAPAGASLAGRGVHLVGARYWVDDPAGDDPRVLWEDQRDGFGYEPFLGVTPSAHQFTQYGRVYSGQLLDVNSHPGDAASLAAMFHASDL